ncbi:MAG: DUF424 family protein [Candidatus Diapherotrites archaeon]|nr:DUF424 family protein [Candidatus Diapherotrites archaeon]
MYVKMYKQGEDTLIAACDKELLGKTLNKDGLNVTISKRFYGGRIVSEDELSLLFDESTIGNLFGEHVIAVAVKKGLVDEENIIKIEGVPHVQFVRMLKWQKKR